MAMITITGRLVKDADLKIADLENPYVLLHIAEPAPLPMRKDLLKDQANTSFKPKSFVYSVFINDPTLLVITMDLKKGEALQVTGRGTLTTENTPNDHQQIILKNIQATEIAFEPFTGKRFKAQPIAANE